MHCQFKYVRRKGADLISSDEQVFDASQITIGSGEDQDICLSDIHVILHHAVIVLKNDVFVIEAVGNEDVRNVHLNALLIHQTKLKLGDILTFGDYEITIVKLDVATATLHLQVEKKSVGKFAAKALKSRSRIGLGDTSLNKRRWAHIGFGLIIVFFLGVPLIGFFVPSVADFLRATPGLPSDNSWSSGTLAAPHHTVGKDCNACHKQAFTMVRNTGCIKCHDKIKAHADPDLIKVNESAKTRCATCHKDHNGMRTSLINSSDDLCTTCHHGLDEMERHAEIMNIVDFDQTHSEFKASVTTYSKGVFDVKRISIAETDSLSEKSNLLFPHSIHMSKNGINGPSGKSVNMVCQDCHEPTVARATFKPIKMKAHCQRCHALTFEADDPTREVPHGDVMDVLMTLQDYYSNRALRGGYNEATAPSMVQQRRRPGQIFSDDEKKAMHDWVLNKASDVGDEVFRFTACSVCHEVLEHKTKPTDKYVTSWDIVPVKITETWYPKAQLFHHKEHENMACTDCHYKKVDTSQIKDIDLRTELENTELASNHSSDVLMPKIADCKTCHSSSIKSTKVESPCIVCHGYHINKQFNMGVIQDETE